jgi:type I restriction enzyme M protein
MSKNHTVKNNGVTSNGRAFTTQQSLNGAIKTICDILRRSNCAGALQYVPELTWILFLRILDESEAYEAEAAEAVGLDFTPSLVAPYRWQDWAAPNGYKREQLQLGQLGGFFAFINGELIPYLRNLKNKIDATRRQRVISEILSGVEKTRVDTERNFLDVIDRVNNISAGNIDDTHIFPLSQVYEGLLLKMGEKGNDGGQFFTPREIIRSMIQVINPQMGETIYDPCCGTGGFLAQIFEYVMAREGEKLTAEGRETLKHRTFFGCEKDNVVYPIALANLVLHGIDQPNIWHGNTLTGGETYGGLFQDAPGQFRIILTNPPFGGKEGKEARTQFAYKTGSTQILFLQHVIDKLAWGGRCGIVLDEGVLFRTNENAYVQVKRKLLNECDVYSIVSLPSGVFTTAGAGVKTNLLFFNKGQRTERVWYYDLSDVKVTKKTPFTRALLDNFFKLLPDRAESDRSWCVRREDLEAKNYDLRAVNPNAKRASDTRTAKELLDIIEAKGREVTEALAVLRREQGE